MKVWPREESPNLVVLNKNARKCSCESPPASFLQAPTTLDGRLVRAAQARRGRKHRRGPIVHNGNVPSAVYVRGEVVTRRVEDRRWGFIGMPRQGRIGEASGAFRQDPSPDHASWQACAASCKARMRMVAPRESHSEGASAAMFGTRNGQLEHGHRRNTPLLLCGKRSKCTVTYQRHSSSTLLLAAHTVVAYY